MKHGSMFNNKQDLLNNYITNIFFNDTSILSSFHLFIFIFKKYFISLLFHTPTHTGTNSIHYRKKNSDKCCHLPMLCVLGEMNENNVEIDFG